jgi:hypothetical protein
LADELLSNIPRATVRRTNAAVVGILGAALYNLVWTSAVLMPRDFALALTGCLLLTVWEDAALDRGRAADRRWHAVSSRTCRGRENSRRWTGVRMKSPEIQGAPDFID